MNRLLIIFILLWCFSNRIHAQYERPDSYFSVGYQYSNFGNSLSQSSIEMAQRNENAIDDGSRFTNDRNAYGLVVRYMLVGNSGLTSEFALGNKKVISKMDYFDSTSMSAVNVTTKQRFRYLTYGLHYATGRWIFGAGIDMGFFSSLKREKGSIIESLNSWHPWFSAPKIFGSGVTAKTPVIGWTLSTSFAITPFTELRLYKQFTAFGMGAELSNKYFSMANWGVELGFTFGE